MNQAALLRAEQAMKKVFFFEIFIFGHSQVQVQAQPGCQAQPSYQQVQVHVICGYSIFWPENASHGKHDLKNIFEVRFTM